MERLERFVVDQYRLRDEVTRAFFEAEAERLANLCAEAAQRFLDGARILAFGMGSAATDAQHVAVEFVHPVVVGKRALPAIALPNDGPTMSGGPAGTDAAFMDAIGRLGRAGDIAIGITHADDDAGTRAVSAALRAASDAQLLTVSLGAARPPRGTWSFSCPHEDPFVVQEVHETLYHLLWELVHVFFEHRAPDAAAAPGSRSDLGAASFLYPMLDRPPKPEGGTSPATAVVDHVASSVLAKAGDLCETRARQAAAPGEVVEAAEVIARRLDGGGKVLCFGNGGSATDAQDLATDLACPPPGLRSRPALCLNNDEAVVTAIANDVGFDSVFSRQVIAFADRADVAVGITTSGSSRNVLRALREARSRGLATVALAGYGGGALNEGGADATLVVDLQDIPRIQEAQASQYHIIRRLLDETAR